MRVLKFALLAILALLLVVAWVAPIGPMPGMFIGASAPIR